MSQPGISMLSTEASTNLAALFKAVDKVIKDWNDKDPSDWDGYSVIDCELLSNLEAACHNMRSALNSNPAGGQ